MSHNTTHSPICLLEDIQVLCALFFKGKQPCVMTNVSMTFINGNTNFKLSTLKDHDFLKQWFFYSYIVWWFNGQMHHWTSSFTCCLYRSWNLPANQDVFPGFSTDAPGLKQAISDKLKKYFLESVQNKLCFFLQTVPQITAETFLVCLIKLFQDVYLWMCLVWCFSHRLELALKDALKEFMEPINTTWRHLYYLYAQHIQNVNPPSLTNWTSRRWKENLQN